jgi:hypothetical protein
MTLSRCPPIIKAIKTLMKKKMMTTLMMVVTVLVMIVMAGCVDGARL